MHPATHRARSRDAAAASLPGGWHAVHHAANFTLVKPAGWSCRVDEPGGFAVVEPRGAAAALVRVRVAPEAVDLGRWLGEGYPGTESGLHNVRMVDLRRGDDGIVLATFDYGSSLRPGRARVVALRCGPVVTLFAAAAAQSVFAERLPDLARILASIRFGTTPGASALLLRCPWTGRSVPVGTRGHHYVALEGDEAGRTAPSHRGLDVGRWLLRG